MLIVWDEPKRKANLAKHGMDFADLDAEFLLDALVIPAKQGRVKFLGSYPAAGDQATEARENADARWRDADDWVRSLQQQIRRG